VIVDEPRLLTVKNGTHILIDGYKEIFLLSISGVIRAFRERQAAHADVRRIQQEITEETHTKDGSR